MPAERRRGIWVFYIFPKDLYTAEELGHVHTFISDNLAPHSISEAISESVDDFITALKEHLTKEVIPQVEEKYNIKARLSEKYPGKGTHILIAKNLELGISSTGGRPFGEELLATAYKECKWYTGPYEHLVWFVPPFDSIIDPEPKRDDNSLGKLFLLLVGLTGAYLLLSD
jgi:hypothetical protein